MERQIALETEMVESGVERMQAVVAAAEEAGRGKDTVYARKLTRHLLTPFADAIRLHLQDGERRGAGAKILRFLSCVEPEQAAYITLSVVFTRLQRFDNRADDDLTKWGTAVGKMIEDEVRFSQFRRQHTAYVDTILADFKRKGSTNYRYMHRVLTHKANKLCETRIAWSPGERTQIGTVLLRLLSESTHAIEFRKLRRHSKLVWTVVIPDEIKDWIAECVQVSGEMSPVYMPCVVPPDTWKGFMDGGYWTPKLRQRVPFVKAYNKEHREYVQRAEMLPARKACSVLQNTPWQVHSGVFSVLRDVWSRGYGCGLPSAIPLEIPASPVSRDVDVRTLTGAEADAFSEWKREAAQAYLAEKERAAKSIQLACVVKLAQRFENEPRMYFPTTTDFRGRMYSTTAGLSPQGPNFGKGLIRFAQGKQIGSGSKWFLVHGANTFGHDKDTYEGRAKYMLDNAQHWCDVAENPLGNRDVWGDADKPWQFLAWCMEFRDFWNVGETHVSHIPVALDGSCNGLQHFSAALRDSVGGAATNLVNSEFPSDIYKQVADVVVQKLLKSTDPLAEQWLAFGVDRKLCKKPVMTMPYGSTRQTCTKSIYGMVYDRERSTGTKCFEQSFAASVWLTKHVWDAIGEVVIAARAAMDWLRKCGALVAKQNMPLAWTSPSGFPVWQCNYETRVRRVETVLLGSTVQLSVGEETKKVHVGRMRNGVSPNFVHSLDASHLVRTVNAAYDEGMRDFACIHDDFGTHAADTERFQQIIREEFVNMYEAGCPLTNFRNEVQERTKVELPDVPERGSLDIREVLHAQHFFG